jgi:hypothetical protein
MSNDREGVYQIESSTGADALERRLQLTEALTEAKRRR